MCEVDGGLGGKTREVTHSVQILGTFVLSIWIRMAISSGDGIGCGGNDKDFLNSCPCDNEMGLVERGNCGGRRCDQVELKSLLFVPFNCWYDEPLFWVTYKFNGLRIKIVSFMICVIYCVAFLLLLCKSGCCCLCWWWCTSSVRTCAKLCDCPKITLLTQLHP